MMERINTRKKTYTWLAKATGQDVNILLQQAAYQAYLFERTENLERIEYTIEEFSQKCETDEDFFNYYLYCAE